MQQLALPIRGQDNAPAPDPDPAVTLQLAGQRAHARVLQRLLGGLDRGGATYDALVGATAKHAGATLLTRDRRAVAIYEVVGATYELVD